MMALILVQAYWINNSIRLKEKQFSLIVNQVLADIGDELKQQETVSQVLEEINTNNIQTHSSAFWSFQLNATTSLHPDSATNLNLKEDLILVSPTEEQSLHGSIELIDDTLIYIIEGDESQPNSTTISVYPKKEVKRELEKSMEENHVFIKRIVDKMMLEEINIENLSIICNLFSHLCPVLQILPFSFCLFYFWL